MRVSDSVSTLAEITGQSRGRFAILARRLQEVGLFPIGSGRHAAHIDAGQAVMLMLADISGVKIHEVAGLVTGICGHRGKVSGAEMTALDFLVALLAMISTSNKIAAPTTNLAATRIVLTLGARPALVARLGTDPPLIYSFTPDGNPPDPDDETGITRSVTIPGAVLHRLAIALAPMLPKPGKSAAFTVPITIEDAA